MTRGEEKALGLSGLEVEEVTIAASGTTVRDRDALKVVLKPLALRGFVTSHQHRKFTSKTRRLVHLGMMMI